MVKITLTTKKISSLTFLDYPIHCETVYFDYVQCSCSSLYQVNIFLLKLVLTELFQLHRTFDACTLHIF